MASKKIQKHTDKSESKKSPITKKPVFYFFAVIIIIIITVSFVGGPIFSKWMSRTSKVVFGKYDGKEISFLPSLSNFFYQRYRINANYYQQMMQLYKNYLDSMSQQEQQSFMNREYQKLWSNSFNETVLHMAFMREAERSGMIITENRVIESFFDFGPYIDENGEYNNELYKATNNADRTEYRKLQYELLVEKQFKEDINTAAELGISEKEKDFIAGMGSPERKFRFVTYNFDDYPLEEILSYADENRDKFQKIQLSRITIKTNKEDAQKIRELALNEEMSFEDLAREYSDKDDHYKDNGGDMGWQYRYDLDFIFNSEETVNEILNLEQGEISKVYEIELEVEKSWVFYRANSYATEPDFSDPETITEVKDYISYYDQNIIEMYFTEIAEKFKTRALESDFLNASVEFNVFPPKQTDYFPVNYGNIFQNKQLTVGGENSDILSQGSNNELFFEELFSLKKGEISEPIVLTKNLIIVEMIDERNASEVDIEAIKNNNKNLKINTMQGELSQTVIDQDLFDNRYFETMMKLTTQ